MIMIDIIVIKEGQHLMPKYMTIPSWLAGWAHANAHISCWVSHKRSKSATLTAFMTASHVNAGLGGLRCAAASL